ELSVNIFSKVLQWLDYSEMADAAAEAGYEGIDLTVRPGGHVLPENVERDLPQAVKAIRKAGLGIPMITTSITSATDPLSERILKTAGGLGVRYYRMGWYRYADKLSIADNLKIFMKDLTAL